MPANFKVSSDIDTLLRKQTKEEAAAFLGLEDAAAVWGQVTGTLSNQTDLQGALDAKAPIADATFTGTTTIPSADITTADFNAGGLGGEVSWNNAEKTLDLVTGSDNVTVQLGQEVVLYVRNNSGATLSDGNVVMISGSQGNNPTISLAQANTVENARKTIGVVTQIIPNNSNGFVTLIGKVRDLVLDNGTYSEGDIVYLSDTVAGGLTAVEPSISVEVGHVLATSNGGNTNGVLEVQINNGAGIYQLEQTLNAAIATKAPIASPTFTGDVTAPRLITNEIQSVGTTSGTAQPITYDSKEHRFRDYDETPSNLMVIKKADGVPIGKVGINQNDPKCALHVVGGHSTGGMADEALRVVGAGLLTSDDETTLVLAMDTDDTANTSDPILKIKRDEREASTGNVEEMNLGFVGANSLYTNQTLNAGYIQVEGGRKFEIATGASSARRLQVSDAGVDITGTATLSEDVKLSDFTSTSRSTGATALDPIQNNQPASDDTITELCVDPSGNVVRGSQEATWTFTRAQLNALTSVRVNLLNSAGADKCVVVEETNWLIEVDLAKAYQATNVKLACEMLGVNENSVATQITAANMNQITQILKTANTNSFGLYHRDVPDLARIYRFDVPMTIRATTGTGSAGTFPDNFVSVKLKIKYRVFDSTTF